MIELEDGTSAPAEPAGPTVGEFLVEWLVTSEPTRRPTTWVSYQYCAHAHVIPHLGEVPLRDLAPEHVRSWQAALLRTPRRFRDGPLSTTTVRYCHRLLRRALQDALRWDLIDRNVCDAVVAPRRADTEMTVWSPPDVRRFLAFVKDDRLVAMWRLFLVTGMRRGEIAGLRWIDVDLEVGRLSVQHTRVLVYDRAQVSEPKTKRSRRVIALDAGTLDATNTPQCVTRTQPSGQSVPRRRPSWGASCNRRMSKRQSPCSKGAGTVSFVRYWVEFGAHDRDR